MSDRPRVIDEGEADHDWLECHTEQGQPAIACVRCGEVRYLGEPADG